MVCPISDEEREIEIQENLSNLKENLECLKNVFEEEEEKFLVFALDYLQENLQNLILFLSVPEQMQELKKVYFSERASGNFILNGRLLQIGLEPC